jgi:predicted phage terminase large subunit-like protein
MNSSSELRERLSQSSEDRRDNIELQYIRKRCELDHLFFARYFFKQRNGAKFRVNWHHRLISDVVQSVIDGGVQNVVINVPPGSSKTELVSIDFMARGLAINPRARFLHISYSDDLAMQNSQTARDIVQSDEYQALWHLEVADDSRAKKRWNVMIDGQKAGGVYAVSLGGQITGFRAGHMAEGFQGAIIIDDPLKVEDAYSRTARNRATRQLVATVRSRKATPTTPIIVIMQRLAEDDPTGFILDGGMGGEWQHINIPALIDDAYVAQLPDKYQRLLDADGERDEEGKFSYWPYKEPLAELKELERINRYVFGSQYMQSPAKEGGEIIKGEWFRRYGVLPKILWKKIYVDTAMKTAERNDYSVFECWGKGEDNKVYLIDLLRGKWEAPELRRRAFAFWEKHKPVDRFDPSLREMVVEDKASGTGLIQDIQENGGIPVKGIERDRDKYERVMGVVSYIEAGLVYVPESADWVSDFLVECESFTSDDTHAHDDQIDPMCDAITDMLATQQTSSIYDRFL